MRAFFFSFVYLGHIYPTLPIIRQLEIDGVSVTLYGLEDHREMIGNSGTVFRPYMVRPEPEANAMQLAAYMTRWAVRLLPGIMKDIEHDQPDFILTDSMLPLGWYAARLSDLPLVVTTTPYVTTKTITDKLGIVEFMRQGDAGTYEADLALFQRAAEELRIQFGIEALSPRDMFQVPGDLTIVTTSRELQPARDLLDETFKFVGPMIGVRGDAPDFPFDQIEGCPTIYISLGTMASNEDFFRTCVEAFTDVPFCVVISTGGKEVSLADLPQNILLRRYVPQLDLLQRIDVFVTHGGWNSINEALYHDVPLVVCPQGKDQFSNAAIVEGLGAGKMLLEITRDNLHTVVDEVLSDKSYSQHAKEIGESLRSAGGAKRAASEIVAFMQQRSSALN